jgi:hypothetical protein
MKDKYAADINDYLKYALLRALVRGDGLGVAWMLTPEDTTGDGRKITYLSQPDRYRRLDPVLFDRLRSLVQRGERTVAAIERAVLLDKAAYVSAILPDPVAGRFLWFSNLWEQVEGRRVLFFDPDNGMSVRSVKRGTRGSSKYLYWDELGSAYDRGHSVIVYQHFPRQPRGQFVSALAARINEEVGCNHVSAIRTPSVAFLVIPQPRDANILRCRLKAFAARAAPLTTATIFESQYR